MKRRAHGGRPVGDMSKSSGLAAQTKVDVAARPILDKRTSLRQGSLFVKDENRMNSQYLDTCNPQVDVKVSVLVDSLFIPWLRWSRQIPILIIPTTSIHRCGRLPFVEWEVCALMTSSLVSMIQAFLARALRIPWTR